MRTRAKICGITRIQDIQSVVQAGADAIGFVFFAPSPRSVTAVQAAELIQHVPAVCADRGFIRECIAGRHTGYFKQCHL